MTLVQDCLGRIYRPLEGCKNCVKDERNLQCSCYQPHNPIELIDVGEVDRDEYGEQGTINRNYMDLPARRLDDNVA